MCLVVSNIDVLKNVFPFPVCCLIISALPFLLSSQKGGLCNYALSVFTVVKMSSNLSYFRMWFKYGPRLKKKIPASIWSLEESDTVK